MFFIHADQNNFLKNDMVKKELFPNYTGSHKLLQRYKIIIPIQKWKKNTVSNNRLKPAYIVKMKENLTQIKEN